MEVKRAQSPDYPAIGLKEAVERCRRLSRQIQTHAAPRQIVAQGIGFNTMHGAAMSAIAALRKYGLLIKQGDTLRLSDLAKRILFPKSDEEKVVALEEAALKPALFADLFQTFGPNPPSELLLTNHLIRAGFLANAAKLAIAAFNESLPYMRGANADLAVNDREEYDSNDELQERSTGEGAPPMSAQQVLERPVAPPPNRPFTFGSAQQAAIVREGERRLFDYDFEADGGVGVVVRGAVDTEEALDVIGAWIDLKRAELARKSGKLAQRASQTVEEEREEDGS